MKHIKHVVEQKEQSFPLAIIVSQFNEPVTKIMKESALSRAEELGFQSDDITLIEVPGAVEIPLIAQRLAEKGEVEAIVCLGIVIRGETSHYDYVCNQVSEGCQLVMMDFNIPVVFGILTTENVEQAWDRLGGSHGNKAKDSIDCAVIMRKTLVAI